MQGTLNYHSVGVRPSVVYSQHMYPMTSSILAVAMQMTVIGYDLSSVEAMVR